MLETHRGPDNIRPSIPGMDLAIERPHPVSVSVLANNALRAHHASAHGGVSTNGLSDILLIFFEMILLSCLK